MLIQIAIAIVLFLIAGYALYPWYCRRGVKPSEATAEFPGDDLVPNSDAGYTLAISIEASPSSVWPWLIQMGQGRGGFYTHEWIENLIGAKIKNADKVIPEFQHLEAGERVRLTPDPYLGKPAQYIEAALVEPPRALVFRQTLPNGALGSWSYVLEPTPNGTTRLIFRRRSTQPSLFDKVMEPGYYFMDMGMLAGIKSRAEGVKQLYASSQ